MFIRFPATDVFSAGVPFCGNNDKVDNRQIRTKCTVRGSRVNWPGEVRTSRCSGVHKPRRFYSYSEKVGTSEGF